MSTFVALLRAVNVGGTSKLPMADLRKMATDAGYTDVETYIASGNLLLESGDDGEAEVSRAIETALFEYCGRDIAVFVRSPEELRRVLDANPFRDEPGNRVAVYFLREQPEPDAADRATGGIAGERVVAGERALYVHYPQGMGTSKLRIPAAAAGTARNVNTVAKLVELAEKRQT